MSAAKYWETPKQFGLTIESNRESALEPQKYPDLDRNSYKAQATSALGLGNQPKAWLDSLKMTGLWNYVVDPDGG